jgi:hypothetical protein
MGEAGHVVQRLPCGQKRIGTSMRYTAFRDLHKLPIPEFEIDAEAAQALLSASRIIAAAGSGLTVQSN